MWTGAMMEILDEARPGHGLSREAIRPHMNAGFPWHEWETILPANRSADEWWNAVAPIFATAFERGGGLPPADAAILGARVRHVFPDPARWRLFEDTQPALEKLTALGYRHVVLSNHVPELENIMAALGIRQHFAAVFNSAVTGVEKPRPEAFHNVLRQFGPADNAVMIGDNPHADADGAKSVGLRAIVVRREKAGYTCCLKLDSEFLRELASCEPS
jgi:putative hydrolase of the HAD superfamily